MCIGIPMQVQRIEDQTAYCLRRGEKGGGEPIDIRLLDGVEPGTWLLTFLGAARSVLSDDDARQVDDALSAVSLALSGNSVDHLFADLIDREPELPAHLQAQSPSIKSGEEPQ